MIIHKYYLLLTLIIIKEETVSKLVILSSINEFPINQNRRRIHLLKILHPFYYLILAINLSFSTSISMVSPGLNLSLKINLALNVSTFFCRNLFKGLAP